MDEKQFKIFMKAFEDLALKMHPAAGTSVPVYVPNFDPFDAEKEGFRNYKERFLNFLKLKNIQDQKTCTKLLLNSIGPAHYDIITSLTAPIDPGETNFDDLLLIIERHLTPQRNVLIAQHQFLSTFQQKHDSLSDFVAALKRHIGDCQFVCPGTCKESIADVFLRTQFISHYCEVHTMNRKSESAEILKQYIKRVESLHEHKVATIKCDKGGEYTALIPWCREKGITLDFSPSASPSNNGKSERLNRTLCDKTRAILFDSGVDKALWTEALRVAAYITNRSPTESKEITPIEIWTGKVPDLSKIQIFGCNAYAKNLKNKTKLGERSTKTIFVGYAPSAYRLWDPVKKKIIISRDVVFINNYENQVQEEEEEEVIRLEFENEDTHEQDEPEKENETLEEENETNIEDEEGDEDENDGDAAAQDWSTRLRKRANRRVDDDYIMDLTNLTEYLEEEEEQQQNPLLLTYQEATTGTEKDDWLKAIAEEVDAINENKTWTLVPREEARDE